MTIEEIEAKYPSAKFGENGYVMADRRVDIVRRDANWKLSEWADLGEWEISLTHQCDEWEIGTPEKAKQFVRDVQEAITYCESRP